MPWFVTGRPGRRKKPELGADLTDLWGAVRGIQQSAGGMASTLSNLALTTTRADMRHEAKMNELDLMIGRVEAVASALAHTLEQLAVTK